MGLTLLAGPANAGKVELLLERYLTRLDDEPVLIVPNASDVEARERDLLRRTGALLGGSIGTFDDLLLRFLGSARGNGGHRSVITPAQRALLLRRLVRDAPLEGLGGSARFAGFADALGAAVSDLEAALVDPRDLDGELGRLYGRYVEELDRLELWDRDLERRHAADRAQGDLDAWDGRPVFAYGFEDLTGAQWALLEALAARGEVTVSLPYEPGRAAFESLGRTAEDLAALADGVEELPASAGFATPPLAYLERNLFSADAKPAPLDGSIRFLEGAGARGALELVSDEILALIRDGTAPESICVVCPSVERWRGPLETAFAALGLPHALEGRVRLGQTAFGHALLSLLRFAWTGGDRADLYGFLRSPYSGLTRAHASFLEGRLRGRAITDPERVEEETLKLRGQPVPVLEALRSAPDHLTALRRLTRSMLTNAYGLTAPPVGDAARLDLRAHDAAATIATELEGWVKLAGPVAPEEVLGALERAEVRLARPQEAGRVAVTDLQRARTRRYEVVFLLGLEEGGLPRRAQAEPFLDDETRDRLDGRRARLKLPDHVARERYLFYTACTRASRRLYLVREAANDEGGPREPSPFWDEVRALFAAEDVERWTRRRALSALTWPLEAAPTERERLRALAALAASDPATATALARANGWERRLERARSAFDRPTRLGHPLVLEELRARGTFGVTELEVFAECSSMWLLERLVDPRTIDAEVDARLRGSVAHTALHRFYAGLPKRLGVERPTTETVEEAVEFVRECVAEAVGGVRLELGALERLELEHGLQRDLERFVRDEARSPSPLQPRRFEVSFGSERSAPELQRGLDLGTFSLSGKIDRIDVDPFSARGIVQDYKSGKTAHSAARIESELRLQIPLYMLVLRDLVGIEPLGGVYRALAGTGATRGLLRAEARDDGLPGFAAKDYLDEEAFWSQVDRAADHARTFVSRIRAGDVRHDPRGGFPCPSWCELAPMCRVRRA